MSKAENKGSTLLEPGQRVMKPAIDDKLATKLIWDLYGMEATGIKEFNGYDDKNIFFKANIVHENKHIDAPSPHGYLLKVTNSEDSKDVEFFDAQHCMILHLAEAGIVVPEPVKNREGKLRYLVDYGISNDKALHIVRVMKFIPGKILFDVDSWTTQHFYQAGEFVGNMAVALKDFSHPAYETRNNIWFLSNIPSVKRFSYAVKDDRNRALVEDIFEDFEREVIPVQDLLEVGYIHGDFNEQNIIVDSRGDIHGVIDFGDSQKNPLVYDIAIAIMYMMTKCGQINPCEVGGHVIAGYQTKRKIPPTELKLMRTLVAARYAQSLTLGAYSYMQEPDEYVLITAKTGWKTLAEFWHIPPDELNKIWIAALLKHIKVK